MSKTRIDRKRPKPFDWVSVVSFNESAIVLNGGYGEQPDYLLFFLASER